MTKLSDDGQIVFGPHLVEVHCVTISIFTTMQKKHSPLTFIFNITVSMSTSTASTYTDFLIPKQPDITGNPYQVFKFDNFLDHLIGGIRCNIIVAIGTINPGSLCIQ